MLQRSSSASKTLNHTAAYDCTYQAPSSFLFSSVRLDKEYSPSNGIYTSCLPYNLPHKPAGKLQRGSPYPKDTRCLSDRRSPTPATRAGALTAGEAQPTVKPDPRARAGKASERVSSAKSEFLDKFDERFEQLKIGPTADDDDDDDGADAVSEGTVRGDSTQPGSVGELSAKEQLFTTD